MDLPVVTGDIAWRADRLGLFDFFRKKFSPPSGENRASLSRKIQESPQDPQARQKLGLYSAAAGGDRGGDRPACKGGHPVRKRRVHGQGDRRPPAAGQERPHQHRISPMAHPVARPARAYGGRTERAAKCCRGRDPVSLRRKEDRILPGGVAEPAGQSASLPPHCGRLPLSEEAVRGHRRDGESGPPRRLLPGWRRISPAG